MHPPQCHWHAISRPTLASQEQAEYERERIAWSAVDFPDNQDCLDLIEARTPPGLLALLDENTKLQSST